MLPFNLEEWKAGKKVVYRNGKTPKSVTHFQNSGVLEKIVSEHPTSSRVYAHFENGFYLDASSDQGSPLDLMMADE